MNFRFYALKLTLVCIIIFIIQLIIPGFTNAFLLNERAYYEIWRFVSAIFLHGNMAHLLYNGFALALFGSILESMIGGKRFLTVFSATGIIANVIAINFYPSSLGASGAIYGIIGALILLRPFLMVWALGLPMPIFAAGIIWAAGDFIGIFTPSNVGNMAHLAGMFFGIILGALYRGYYKKNNIKEGVKSNKIKLDEGSMQKWEDKYIR